MILLALLWSFLVPAINHAVKFTDPVRPGDVMNLGDGLTFVPAPGWNVQAGERTTDRVLSGAHGGPVTLAKGGVALSITPQAWTGNAKSLLTQVREANRDFDRKQGYHLTAEPTTFTTKQGVPGLLETFGTTHHDGIRAALVIDGIGVMVYAAGAPSLMTANLPEIHSMIDSIGRRG